VRQTGCTETRIVAILAQAAKGEMAAIAVCRINGISEQTFYRWKRRCGEMQVSEVRRLRELEAEAKDDAELLAAIVEIRRELDATPSDVTMRGVTRRLRAGIVYRADSPSSGTGVAVIAPNRSRNHRRRAFLEGAGDNRTTT
jgi:putative transposase